MAKTRIRVTRPGLHGAEGAIPVGTEFEVEDVPKSWGNKVEKIGEATGNTTVTNEDKSEDERMALFRDVVGRIDDDGKREDGSPEVRAINEKLPKGTRNFSAEERDRLWAQMSSEG